MHRCTRAPRRLPFRHAAHHAVRDGSGTGAAALTGLIGTLWELLIENSLMRWFSIGLLIGLGVVCYMISQDADISAGDAIMGIVASGVLVLGMRLVLWFFRA